MIKRHGFFAGSRREYVNAIVGVIGGVVAALSQVEVQHISNRDDAITRSEADKSAADRDRYEDLLNACIQRQIDRLNGVPHETR